MSLPTTRKAQKAVAKESDIYSELATLTKQPWCVELFYFYITSRRGSGPYHVFLPDSSKNARLKQGELGNKHNNVRAIRHVHVNRQTVAISSASVFVPVAKQEEYQHEDYKHKMRLKTMDQFASTGPARVGES